MQLAANGKIKKKRKTSNESSQIFSKIRAVLRRLWMWSPARANAKHAARMARGVYICSTCRGYIGQKDLQIDHVKACGTLTKWSDLSGFAERLFTGELRALCKSCHAAITKAQREAAREAKL